ncbi:TPA: hypothetical protein NV714_002689 [Escherichia coli]|nr:hypothetical protein [Escherichia coli]
MKKAKLVKARIIKIDRGSHTVHTFEDDNDIEEIKEGAKLKVNIAGQEDELYFDKKLSDKYIEKTVYLMIDEKKKEILKLVNKKNVNELEKCSRSMFIINALANAFFRSVAIMAIALAFMIFVLEIDFGIEDIFDFIDASISLVISFWWATLIISVFSIAIDFYVKLYNKTKYIIPYFGFFKFYYLKIKLAFNK